MPELIAFKSGKDPGEETRIALVETVTCIECAKWRPMSGHMKRVGKSIPSSARIASTGH